MRQQAGLSAKKHSADEFDIFDPRYCQLVIKLLVNV